jgi:hypothetical protein
MKALTGSAAMEDMAGLMGRGDVWARGMLTAANVSTLEDRKFTVGPKRDSCLDQGQTCQGCDVAAPATSRADCV